MLRQSTAERVKIFLTTSVGTPVTGLVATDFKGSNAFLYKSDGSKTTIALTLGGNLFEEDATDSPGIYALNLTTTHTNTLGSLTVSFQPSATAFTPTYFFDSVEADSTANVSAIKAKTDNLPATPADQTTSLAIKAKTDLIGTSTVASQSDVTTARDSIKGAQLLDISTIAGGASFTAVTDSLHEIASTAAGGATPAQVTTIVNAARDSVKGPQLLSISDIAGNAAFTTGDDLHSIKTAITGIGTGLASAVFEELLSGHMTTGTFGEFVNLLSAIYSNRVRVDRTTKKMIIYAADSVTPIKSYNLYDLNSIPADINASERSKII